MFNDRFGLTDAVLEGRKIVTRRIVPDKILEEYYIYDDWCLSVGVSGCGDVERQYNNLSEFIIGERWLPYQVGEIVAISQSMRNVCSGSDLDIRFLEIAYGAAWNNKMFVKASLMPHQIQMLDVRVERLQDITDEDCIKEGIQADEDNYFFRYDPKGDFIFTSPIDAFSELIDKVSKKGTWESNPYVFRYEFKLLTGTDLKVKV